MRRLIALVNIDALVICFLPEYFTKGNFRQNLTIFAQFRAGVFFSQTKRIHSFERSSSRLSGLRNNLISQTQRGRGATQFSPACIVGTGLYFFRQRHTLITCFEL